MSQAFVIDDLPCWVVSDGPLTLDAPHAIWRGSAGLSRDPLRAEQNCLLLRSEDGLVLIDAGLGNTRLFGDESGRLLTNLAKLAVDPAEVAAVLLTHAHSDHCWGLTLDDGMPAFPNATIHLARAEVEHWAQAPGADGDWVRRHLLPMQNRLRFVVPKEATLPGITALAAAGHTPGHTIYRIDRNGDRLLVTGDLFLNAPLSFAQAAAVNVYDMHPVDAAATRMRVLAGLASSGERLLGYHLAWPGLGRVRQTADGFAFEAEPADRSAVKR